MNPYSQNEIPQQRFYKPPTQGPCAKNQNKSLIRIRKNDHVKHFLANQQTLQQMINEFDKQFQNKSKQLHQKYVPIVKDPKFPQKRIIIAKNKTARQLFNEGKYDIQLQLALNQNGQLKYPEINEYQQPQKYFPKNAKIVSKIIKQIISVKLILQQKGHQQKKVCVQIETSQSVMDLKLKAQAAFSLSSVKNIFLQDSLAGILNDNNPIYMEKLSNNAQIYVRIMESNFCFTGDTNVKVIIYNQQKGKKIIQQRLISQLKVGQQIISYNEHKNKFETDRITYIKKLNTKLIMKLEAQNGRSIKSTEGDIYLTGQGWKKHSVYGNSELNPEILKDKLSTNDYLMVFPNTYQENEHINQSEEIIDNKRELNIINPIKAKVSKISIQQHNQPVEVYHLSIQNNHTYIVNDFIVHNMQIKIKNPKNNHTFQINASPLDLVQNIKVKVAQIIKIDQSKFNLMYVHKELQTHKSLQDYKINKGDQLLINYLNNIVYIKPVAIQEKLIVVKDNQNTYQFKYTPYKQKTIYQFIKMFKKAPPKHCSLLHGKMFLRPSDKVKKVQQSTEFKQLTQIHCILVQSAQKKLFYQQILTNDYSKVIESYKKNPSNLKQLIAKFRTSQFNKNISQQIFRFDPSDQQSLDPLQFSQIREVSLAFMSIQRYTNSTGNYMIRDQNDDKQKPRNVFQYDLYKKQTFSNFQSRYKVGQCLYFKQFLHTKKKNYKEVILDQPLKSTIFFIRSLSGVNLGKIPNSQQEEIVFLPFTYFTVDYFLVDNKQKPTKQFVFLTQMQTLYGYEKPFLLWVDDLPNNGSNQKIYTQIKQNNPGVQIMKLLSTKQAEAWMNQFAWLVNWQNIKFKIISDMTRYQISNQQISHSLQDVQNDNYLIIEQKNSAAIDLIEICTQQEGFTTLITIFCMNKQNAQNRVNERQLQRGLDYHEIIIDMKGLKENINKFFTNEKYQ